ncbi:MAG: Hpt domain-containing protein [Rudaea sp.]
MSDTGVIDRAALKRLFEILGKDPQMLGEMMDEFFEDAPTFIARMRSALERGSAEELRIAAHSCKSNSASFGALALAEKCRAVEMLAKAGTFDGVAEGIAEIEQEYPRAKAELESIRLAA